MGDDKDEIDAFFAALDKALTGGPAAAERFISESEIMICSAVRSSHISPEEKAKLEAAFVMLDAIIGGSKDSEAGYNALLTVMKIVNAIGARGSRFEESAIARYTSMMQGRRGYEKSPVGQNKRQNADRAWRNEAEDYIQERLKENPHYTRIGLAKDVKDWIGLGTPDVLQIRDWISGLIKKGRITPPAKKSGKGALY